MSLPLELAACSRGYAVLTPAARRLGSEVAAAASCALAALTGGEVGISGRAIPAVPSAGAGAAVLLLELGALPASGWIEVDARIGVALLDRLCGGMGEDAPATRPTPLEEAALELAALACVDAAAGIPAVRRLSPRLVRGASGPMEGLCVELSIRIGVSEGRARLVLPRAAVLAIGGRDDGEERAAHLPVDLSIRSGGAPLSPDELADLAPGDVVLVDPFPEGRWVAVGPGGLRASGPASDDTLRIEEIHVSDPITEHPVALEVELARLTLTLGELIRLQPDSILPLGIDRSGAVTLKLGDRTVARGRLVDVEGAIGVRIESLAGEAR